MAKNQKKEKKTKLKGSMSQHGLANSISQHGLTNSISQHGIPNMNPEFPLHAWTTFRMAVTGSIIDRALGRDKCGTQRAPDNNDLANTIKSDSLLEYLKSTKADDTLVTGMHPDTYLYFGLPRAKLSSKEKQQPNPVNL